MAKNGLSDYIVDNFGDPAEFWKICPWSSHAMYRYYRESKNELKFNVIFKGVLAVSMSEKWKSGCYEQGKQ